MSDIIPAGGALPAYLGTGKTTRFGNTDASDLVIPRIKLLQPLSPEIEEYPEAKAGNFWHTVRQQNLGNDLLAIPINLRKTFVLWAPRGDDRGILARSTDAIHWEPPEGEFKVKFKLDPTTYTWRLKPTVSESGLDQFGSSRPGDPQSTPAAALTYEFLWYFPELETVALMLNTRGSVKVAQDLITAVDDRPRDHFLQLYRIKVRKSVSKSGDAYDNYAYSAVGYVDEAMAEKTRALYHRFNGAAYQANDESDDSEGSAQMPRQASAQRDADTRF